MEEFPPPKLPTESPIQQPKHTHKKVLFILVGLLIVGLIFCVTWFMLRQHTASPSSPPSRNLTLEAHYSSIAKYGIASFSNDRKEVYLRGYRDLAGDFQLTPNALDDVSTLQALGIIDCYLRDKSNKTRYRTELYLLLIDHLTALPRGINDSTFTPASAHHDHKLLESYQDAALSKSVVDSSSLQKAIDNTVTQLHLASRSDIQPYKIIAFNFTNDSSQFNELTRQHSLYGAHPKMWAEKLDGTTYIMMTKPYADDVLAGRANSLPHEFIHGQSAFVRGEAGRMIEERRAELFSGDTSAYYDVKQLFIYTKVFTDVDMLSLLHQYPAAPAKFYAELYTKLGIDATNALIFSWPSAYSNGPSQAINSIDTLNNQDKALQFALEQGKKDQSALTARLKARYNSLLGSLKTVQAVKDHLEHSIADTDRLPTAAQAMLDYIKTTP